LDLLGPKEQSGNSATSKQTATPSTEKTKPTPVANTDGIFIRD